MDRTQDFASAQGLHDATADDSDYAVDAPAVVIGDDERRMHVRAYNHWVSLLGGRAYPSIEDLEPETHDDFGPHSVLLDFTAGAENPAISYLGAKLSHECGFETEPQTVSQVPSRSLLSRLTDHYLQIIANRAPIGFEAEFVNTRGHNTMYRGILLPLSSDDDTIDFIHGVINWKEVVGGAEADALASEVAGAFASASPRQPVPVWADGPNGTPPRNGPTLPAVLETEADFGDDTDGEAPGAAPDADAGLGDWLASARETAEAMLRADSRSRTALYAALGAAYDFALQADRQPDDYALLLEDSGIVGQARAPMTPVVKLVFGTGYDKTRLTEFASALSYAKRHELPVGGMQVFLEHYPGGLKAIVAADRRERRPAGKPANPDRAREAARALEAQATLALPGDDEFVVLVARRIDAERVAVIGVVPDDKPLMDRALRAVTG
ncbi:MAG: hypothetical protein ACKVOP_09515 [Sphingomonadaceae bacterium]